MFNLMSNMFTLFQKNNNPQKSNNYYVTLPMIQKHANLPVYGIPNITPMNNQQFNDMAGQMAK